MTVLLWDYFEQHWGEWLLMSLFWFLIVALCVVIIGAIAQEITYLLTPWSKPFFINARVKSLSHSLAQDSTGVGFSTGGQAVVTSSHYDETWVVDLVLENGDVHTENCEQLWDDVDQGDKLKLEFRTKTVWDTTHHDLLSWEKI